MCAKEKHRGQKRERPSDPCRVAFPGSRLASLRDVTENHRRDEFGAECEQWHDGFLAEHGEMQPALREEEAGKKRRRRAVGRQKLGEDGVPEIKLEQERHVAERLHIGASQGADERVAREAAKADEYADERREQYSSSAHREGVQKADEKRPAIGRVRVVREKALPDVEAGGAVQEREPGADRACAEIADDVEGEKAGERDDKGEDERLEQEGARERRVPPHGEGARRGR